MQHAGFLHGVQRVQNLSSCRWLILCLLNRFRRMDVPSWGTPLRAAAGPRGVRSLAPALLLQTASGNVEAKVVCFYRRRDISSTLIALADKHARETEEEMENPEMADLPEKLKHQLRHRELFLSRQLESLPATHIRRGWERSHGGRCLGLAVTHELPTLSPRRPTGAAFPHGLGGPGREPTDCARARRPARASGTQSSGAGAAAAHTDLHPEEPSALTQELAAARGAGAARSNHEGDFFFYSLVYDPQQKTLLADKGEIRVGNRYQADITDLLKEGEEDGRDQSKLETKVWEARNPLVDKQIDQFLVVARSSVRQPSLHMSAAAASRDITLTRQAFYLHTTKLTRIARRLCRTARLPGASQSPLVLKQAARKPLEAVLRHLGLANHGQTRHMVRLIRGGSLPPVKRRRMNWIDAPDDVFYMATEETRCPHPMNQPVVLAALSCSCLGRHRPEGGLGEDARLVWDSSPPWAQPAPICPGMDLGGGLASLRPSLLGGVARGI
ncbi:hypothetical protein E2I00_006040 [Balaenoptera physalus]|uniref:ELM2 domain-containing protein n=1 Tax=Balaenoptera physalus TaxID=9770 RepID=A0A643CF36_BALPH|nr:hypothetical protein E2I00_006040 [Balaenoptera physalus]